MKTYPMKVEDGKVYAEVTLRDVVERCDVSDLPMLAEVKRLYDENAKLREFAGQVLYFTTMTDGCGDNCPYSSSDCRHECYLREQGRELGLEVPDE